MLGEVKQEDDFGDINFHFALKLFRSIIHRDDDRPRRKVSTVLVCHAVPDIIPFITAVGEISDIHSLIIKPRSIHKPTLRVLEKKYSISDLTKESIALNTFQEDLTCKLPENKYVIIDIGGYFAPLVHRRSNALNSQLLAVIEDTENGVQKYEAGGQFTAPVFHVARSALKEPEDHLVGQAIAFAAETLLRQVGTLLLHKKTCVFGYGKIGRSIVATLAARGLPVTVCETDPMRAVQCLSHGYVVADQDTALRDADVIFSATGSKGLGVNALRKIKNGAFVASVTSADDEFDLTGFSDYMTTEKEKHRIVKVKNRHNKKIFYMLNGGNAVNFMYSANIGPFIQLIQAEILFILNKITKNDSPLKPGCYQVSEEERRDIAGTWLTEYQKLSSIQ